MTEEKRNRIIAAVTVNVILLIVILAAVCIYQLVAIVRLNNLKKEIARQTEYYEAIEEKDRNTLDYYKSEEGLLDLAYQYGFVLKK